MRRRTAAAQSLVITFVLACRVESQLRRRPLHALATWAGVDVETSSAAAPVVGVPLDWRQRRIVNDVERFYRFWPGDGPCLRRSLVTARRLALPGLVLRLGVGRDKSQSLTAHAWLELGGATWDPIAPEYSAFQRIDPRHAS